MTDEKLTDAVNRSGFPLQIGLEHLVKNQCSELWKTIYSEHSWKNPFDSSSGFIDLILEDVNRTTVLIVEAKKVVDTTWIFLVSQEPQMNRKHVKTWITYMSDSYSDYLDIKTDPSTVESKFCVVDGQDSKSRPMLERLASEAVSSTEGFANEEKTLLKSYDLRMYFSVIVTTAILKVCKTNPDDISISTGQLKAVELNEVPYLRFRKQLNYNITSKYNYSEIDYREVARQKENTVFIVNSDHFLDFLKEFEVDSRSLQLGIDSRRST